MTEAACPLLSQANLYISISHGCHHKDPCSTVQTWDCLTNTNHQIIKPSIKLSSGHKTLVSQSVQGEGEILYCRTLGSGH